MVLSGLLLPGMQAPEDNVLNVSDLSKSQMSLVLPLDNQRFRAYFGYRKRSDSTVLSGPGRVKDFIEASKGSGVPADWFEGAEAVGPLALKLSQHTLDTMMLLSPSMLLSSSSIKAMGMAELHCEPIGTA
jgi:hypothetical protein